MKHFKYEDKTHLFMSLEVFFLGSVSLRGSCEGTAVQC